ncbi:hypothetical protein [Gynuella sunshinyii]|uniref:Uncharacterized protein n=1 Tax=Gynuella sunshinyii YC6258 TaxID=1445510 RepID=A0A0C5V3R3_9GAMM|nr:hypothetical protein [Gynuella sunshinyii]AJQ94135.1 hypothetical Protein YC6258_02093 [Gynuella sunshinyii YC6258]
MKKILISLFMLLSINVLAAYKDSDDVKIQLISVVSSSGDILVQTNPEHSIEGLGCTNNFWLTLDSNEPGYQAVLSLLLSAQVTQRNVTVRARDSGGEHCVLERVITKP